jgi:prolyl 4-hydroxylase
MLSVRLHDILSISRVLEVYDRHDRAVNVTMEPGDMVLYESGSLIHGRPFPLKGKYFANIFIHFEPTGRRLGASEPYVTTSDLPPYLNANTPEADHWLKMHPGGWKKPVPSAPAQQIPSPEGHHAAANGDIESLSKIAASNRKAFYAKDSNGWQPIHEAVRGGHLAAVELLVRHGASKDARTGRTGKGYSPLKLALHQHSADHPITQYLLQIGATSYDDEEL